MAKTVIKNIGMLISGDFSNPLLEGDTLVIENGRILQTGYWKDCQTEGAHKVIDAKGSTVAPGLIDSHVHPVFGDFTPRQRAVDFIDSELHGGVTTMISAGEVHLPGRPKDIVGVKALAIVAVRSFKNLRPSGVKVHAGAPILELGMVEEDFAEMAQAGVKLIGEIGLGSVKEGKDAAPMVRWAKKYGMTVTIHTGGPSIAGSNAINADTVMEASPHIVGHINGGHTAMLLKDIEKLVTQTDMALEIVHCGNIKAALHTLTLARETGNLHRIIIGNDAPSGTGVIPLGILRVLSFLSSFEEVAPEQIFAMATGNTARVHNLPVGLIKPGYEADLIIIDAPIGSAGKDALSALKAGDLPGISMVLIDGEIKVQKSRNTPPAARMAEVS
jgi:enamidase